MSAHAAARAGCPGSPEAGDDGAEPMGLRALVGGDFAAWQRVWAQGHGQASRPPGVLSRLSFVWTYAGLRATLVYRLSHALYRRRVKVLPQLLWRMNIGMHGFDVPASVPIGPGLYVPHPVGTVVMARRIGERCTLVSGITVGMRSDRSFPTIGDDVYIGAGARVLGGITVGSRVSIGANAVVIADVPSDSVAVGVPARWRARGASAQAGAGDLESPALRLVGSETQPLEPCTAGGHPPGIR